MNSRKTAKLWFEAKLRGRSGRARRQRGHANRRRAPPVDPAPGRPPAESLTGSSRLVGEDVFDLDLADTGTRFEGCRYYFIVTRSHGDHARRCSRRVSLSAQTDWTVAWRHEAVRDTHPRRASRPLLVHRPVAPLRAPGAYQTDRQRVETDTLEALYVRRPRGTICSGLTSMRVVDDILRSALPVSPGRGRRRLHPRAGWTGQDSDRGAARGRSDRRAHVVRLACPNGVDDEPRPDSGRGACPLEPELGRFFRVRISSEI